MPPVNCECSLRSRVLAAHVGSHKTRMDVINHHSVPHRLGQNPGEGADSHLRHRIGGNKVGGYEAPRPPCL